MARSKAAKPKPSNNWNPQRVHELRSKYEEAIQSGLHPKSAQEAFEYDGVEYTTGWAYYLLEYLETVVFWPPQSRLYKAPTPLTPPTK